VTDEGPKAHQNWDRGPVLREWQRVHVARIHGTSR